MIFTTFSILRENFLFNQSNNIESTYKDYVTLFVTFVVVLIGAIYKFWVELGEIRDGGIIKYMNAKG